MRDIGQLIRRFGADERGVFLVFFGVIAIVLIATAGAVVDFTTIEQSRARAQDALDSTALGLQPTIFDAAVTEATIKPQAQQLLVERLSDASVVAEVTTVTISKPDGMLRIEASITVPMSFVSLVGIETISANVLSEATRKRLNIEVAMVLDNSGSMASSSRMTNLKAAALCATNILLNGDCAATATSADTTQVKIGVVPFTEFVNVGTGYKNAGWMDTAGLSSISSDNFDDDDNDATPFTGAVDRFALYDQLSNVSWQGCVEARKYPYDTNDTPPTTSVPDTLFVPEFAPDTPDSGGFDNNYLSDTASASCRVAPTWTWAQVKTVCNKNGNNNQSNYNSASCSSTTNSYAQTNELGASVSPASTSQPADDSAAAYYNASSCTTTYTSVKTQSSPNRWTNTKTVNCVYNYSQRELQERLCKYTGSISTSGGKGPNWDCPTNAMLPLTNTKSSVVAAINAMYPQGYTNIHQGVIWGFHMLSPTEPLTEGAAYDTATFKVMIVMTDGENTVDGYDSANMNRADGYMAYGFPGSPAQGYNGRVFSSAYPNPASGGQVTAAMNSRTTETCANAKAAGITVYTIGLNSPNSTTTTMLTNCASSASKAYFPSSSSELVPVFAEIASQLANLRLAK